MIRPPPGSPDARARYEADPGLQDSDVHRRLVTAGLSDTEAATVAGIVGKHPETSLKLAAGLDLGTDQPARQSPVVQSVWMFFTNLFAAAVPVVPFGINPENTVGRAAGSPHSRDPR